MSIRSISDESSEAGIRIEGRHTQPVDRPFPRDQGCGVLITDQGMVLNPRWQASHPSVFSFLQNRSTDLGVVHQITLLSTTGAGRLFRFVPARSLNIDKNSSRGTTVRLYRFWSGRWNVILLDNPVPTPVHLGSARTTRKLHSWIHMGRKVLVVDIGGNTVKMLVTGITEPRKFPSGPTLTPRRMALGVNKLAEDWNYDVISIGYPGRTRDNHPVAEPRNLARGWVKFNFTKAFHMPVKVLNDAAMQALGSYQGGTMLFLGLGTGLGTALVVNGNIAPMELGGLSYKNKTYEDFLGLRGLKHFGITKWREYVWEIVERFIAALELDDVVIGGGNVNKLGKLPPGCRAGDNALAFHGGFLLWK